MSDKKLKKLKKVKIVVEILVGVVSIYVLLF